MGAGRCWDPGFFVGDMATYSKIRSEALVRSSIVSLALGAGVAFLVSPETSLGGYFLITQTVILAALGVSLLVKIVAILRQAVTENRSDQSKTLSLQQWLSLTVWITFKVAVFFAVILVMKRMMPHQATLAGGAVSLAAVPIFFGLFQKSRVEDEKTKTS